MINIHQPFSLPLKKVSDLPFFEETQKSTYTRSCLDLTPAYLSSFISPHDSFPNPLLQAQRSFSVHNSKPLKWVCSIWNTLHQGLPAVNAYSSILVKASPNEESLPYLLPNHIKTFFYALTLLLVAFEVFIAVIWHLLVWFLMPEY